MKRDMVGFDRMEGRSNNWKLLQGVIFFKGCLVFLFVALQVFVSFVEQRCQ